MRLFDCGYCGKSFGAGEGYRLDPQQACGCEDALCNECVEKMSPTEFIEYVSPDGVYCLLEMWDYIEVDKDDCEEDDDDEEATSKMPLGNGVIRRSNG